MGGIIGGVLGAFGGYKDAKQAKKEHEKGSTVDHTTTRTPYNQAHMDEILQRALEEGRRTPPKMPGKRPGFGPGGTSRDAAKDLLKQAGDKTQTQQAGEDWIQTTLGGQDTNPYRKETYQDLKDYRPEFLDQMIAELGGFGGERGGSAYDDPYLQGEEQQRSNAPPQAQAAGGWVSGPQGPTLASPQARAAQAAQAQARAGAGSSPHGSPEDRMQDAGVSGYIGNAIKDIIEGRFGSGSEDFTNWLDMNQRRMQDQFLQQVMPTLDAQAEAAGRFRGGEQAKGAAAAGLAQSVGDMSVQAAMENRRAEMGAIMDAIGQGSGRDLANMGDLTQRYGIDTQAETQRAGQAAAAHAASSGAAARSKSFQDELQWKGEQNARDRALQQRLSEQGMLFDVMGMGDAAGQFGLAGRGDLSADFGADQRAAGGLGLDYGQADFYRQLGAMDPMLALEEMGQRGKIAGYEADQNRFLYNANANRDKIGWEADLFNRLAGPYGDTRTAGVTHTPYTGPSAAGGAISGLLGGFGLGSGFGGGGGGSAPAPSPYGPYAGGYQYPPR